VIASYREEFKTDPSVRRFLGSSLMKFGRFYYRQDEPQKALPLLQEGVDLLKGCGTRNNLTLSELAEGVLLMIHSKILMKQIDARELFKAFEYALELIDSLPDDESFDMIREKLQNLTTPIQQSFSQFN
jgi:hypothetical protein